MRKLLAHLVVLATILALLPARAFAEPRPEGEKKKPAGDEILLYARHLERRAEEHIVVGEGAVEIISKDLRLAADRVVYHEETRDVVADGHVVLDSGTDRLQGEHIELNVDTRIGFIEHGQGFVQTYYFTGERIDKLGPDRYLIRGGTFTTCEGTLPDWSFHATTTTITIDEYLHAWNPSMWIKMAPVFYIPYAVFPIKRDRSTGLLVPEIRYRNLDGLVIRNKFYWAPRDNVDATLGIDYLQKTGWGGSGELRYLLAPKTHGEISGYYTKNPDTDAERWIVTSDLSHELPLGVHGRADVQFQSDREFTSRYGDTLEQRSSERTTSSFYLNRSWSAYDVALAGRYEVSLLTEARTTLTRFPELTLDRASTRLFGSDVFLKLSMSGVGLGKKNETTDLATLRAYAAPEVSWPISLGGVVSLLPAAGYSLTYYSEDTNGEAATRSLPYYRFGIEGPKVYRVFEFGSSGTIEKLKHLIEPRISYNYTPEIDQAHIPQFDSIDNVSAANRLDYSLTNTVYAKVRSPAPKPGPAGAAGDGSMPAGGDAVPPGAARPAETSPQTRTEELLWVKLAQSYNLEQGSDADAGHRRSPVEWDARTHPLPGIELWWKGNFGTYGEGVGYQNVSLSWKAWEAATFKGEWRTTKDTGQDFLDLGLNLAYSRVSLDGRSRYNLGEGTFVENRLTLKYASQCWDLTLGYVKWTSNYEYAVQLSLKGIGTIVKL